MAVSVVVLSLLYLNLYYFIQDIYSIGIVAAFSDITSQSGFAIIGWPRAFIYVEWLPYQFCLDVAIWLLIIAGWIRLQHKFQLRRVGALARFLFLASLLAFALAEPRFRNYHDETALDRLDDLSFTVVALGIANALFEAPNVIHAVLRKLPRANQRFLSERRS